MFIVWDEKNAKHCHILITGFMFLVTEIFGNTATVVRMRLEVAEFLQLDTQNILGKFSHEMVI